MTKRPPATKGRAVSCSPTAARELRWSDAAAAVPATVPMLRCALVAFAAGHGAQPETQGSVALAASEAITNAVVHAFAGMATGTVTVDAVVRGDRLHVTITDDGCGMRRRTDSPGLGLGLSVIAGVTESASIGPGADGRGTEITLGFPLP